MYTILSFLKRNTKSVIAAASLIFLGSVFIFGVCNISRTIPASMGQTLEYTAEFQKTVLTPDGKIYALATDGLVDLDRPSTLVLSGYYTAICRYVASGVIVLYSPQSGISIFDLKSHRVIQRFPLSSGEFDIVGFTGIPGKIILHDRSNNAIIFSTISFTDKQYCLAPFKRVIFPLDFPAQFKVDFLSLCDSFCIVRCDARIWKGVFDQSSSPLQLNGIVPITSVLCSESKIVAFHSLGTEYDCDAQICRRTVSIADSINAEHFWSSHGFTVVAISAYSSDTSTVALVVKDFNGLPYHVVIFDLTTFSVLHVMKLPEDDISGIHYAASDRMFVVGLTNRRFVRYRY